MRFIAEKFDAKYKGAKSIPIYVCTENPISRRYVRYNQSGIACKKSFDQEKAIDRKNNLVECSNDCQYRKAEQGKVPACREELNFTFMIPDICEDRVFLLQTKAFNSRTELGDYFDFQKQQGNSVIGKYNLFLHPTEVVSPDGIRSTHYVYGIVKAEDQVAVITDNTVVTEERPTATIPVETQTVEVPKEETEKEVVKEPTPKKKSTKSKVAETPKEPVVTEVKAPEEEKSTDDKMAKYHVLLDTSTIQLEKDGKMVDYLLGKFSNMKDEEVEAIIHTNYVEEFKGCDLRNTGIAGLNKT